MLVAGKREWKRGARSKVLQVGSPRHRREKSGGLLCRRAGRRERRRGACEMRLGGIQAEEAKETESRRSLGVGRGERDCGGGRWGSPGRNRSPPNDLGNWRGEVGDKNQNVTKGRNSDDLSAHTSSTDFG